MAVRSSNRARRLVAVLAAGLFVLGTGVTAAGAAGTPQPTGYAAQVQRAGFTAEQAKELQARVDQVIAEDGGTQIAPNKVLWKDGKGDTTIPLPGETRARDLNQSPAALAAWPYGCNYYNLCLYEGGDFTGLKGSLYDCREYHVPYYFESYVNNQTRGTVGAFRNSDHGHIAFTRAAPSSARYDYGTTTFYVQPC